MIRNYNYSSKYNTVYHIMLDGKSLCNFEHNKQRKRGTLDILSDTAPDNHRACKLCSIQDKKNNAYLRS